MKIEQAVWDAAATQNMAANEIALRITQHTINAERERCVGIAETCEIVLTLSPRLRDGVQKARRNIAAAIRSAQEQDL